MSKYPQLPGFQAMSDTSREAAESVINTARSHSETLRQYFTSALGKGIGLTIDEAAVFLAKEFKKDIQTGGAAARMRGLELLGVIAKSSSRRTTRAKKKAVVYFLKGYENQ